MATNEIRAGGAFVELYVKSQGLARGLAAANQHLRNFGSRSLAIGTAVMGLGSAIVAPLAAAVHQFVEMGSQLDDVSKRTGVAASSLVELKYAAEQSGTSFETVEKSILKLQKNGFSADKFDEIAASIAAIEDPAERTRQAMDKFGKSGAELLPMFEELADLRKEANRLGLVPTDASVAAAAKLGDTFDQVKSVILASIYEIGSALAPVLQPALELTRELGASVTKWVRANGQLVRSIAGIGLAVMGVGAGIATLGVSAIIASAAFGAIGTAIGIIATGVGLLATPLGAVTALLVGGVTYWAMFTESGQAAVAEVREVFIEMGKTLKDTWGGVVDALAAGDLQLAAKVAWAGLKVVWHQGTQDINKAWLDAKWYFLTIWEEAKTGLAKIFVGIWAGMQRGWEEAIAAMKSTWNTFSTFVGDALDVTKTVMADGWDQSMVKLGRMTQAEADARKAERQEAMVASVGARMETSSEYESKAKAAYDKRMEEINAAEAGAKGILDSDRARRQDEIDSEYNKALASKEKALADAQAELNGARAKAAEGAAVAGMQRTRPGFAGMEAVLPRSVGSFDANSLMRNFGGGKSEKQLLQESLKTAQDQLKESKKLLAAIQSGKVVVLN